MLLALLYDDQGGVTRFYGDAASIDEADREKLAGATRVKGVAAIPRFGNHAR